MSAAAEVARGMREGTLPPFIGIRIKPLSEELKTRGVRTLDLFMTALLDATGGVAPGRFVVTLPKVTHPEQVSALAGLLEELESNHRLTHGSLNLELMVETPQALIDSRGALALPSLVAAGKGRCIAAHFGPYDYTAALEITADCQSMDHPACDFARHLMKAALAGTGISLSDGPTNILPVGPHRGTKLTPAQKKENKESVHRAWRLSYGHITHSLENGFYRGWDLHPAQLPVRYAAVYLFFRRGLAGATARLRTFVERATRATLTGDLFDDAATGQGLLNFFLRGLGCGSIGEEEVLAAGLTLEELTSRSFAAILRMRRSRNT
jgi:citrate lyase beta subunit